MQVLHEMFERHLETLSYTFRPTLLFNLIYMNSFKLNILYISHRLNENNDDIINDIATIRNSAIIIIDKFQCLMREVTLRI